MTDTQVTGRLLTARQVADLLGVSTETVLRWTRRGDLPAIKLPGGAVRFRASELDEWIEERATLRRGSANQPDERRPGGTVALLSGAPTNPSSDDEEKT